VNVSAVTLVHLIKLIDGADSSVCQDEGTTLKDKLASDGIFEHSSCQTDARATLSCRVDASRRKVGDMFEELRFGNTRIAHKENIDISSDLHAVVHFFRDSANHEKQQGYLDLLHAEDFWADRLSKANNQVVVILTSSTDVIDSFHAFFCQKSLPEVLLLFLNLESLNEGVLEQARPLETIGWLWHEDACHIDHVTRCARSCDLSTCNNFQHSGHMTNRYLIAGFLDLDVLVGDEARRLDLEDQLSVNSVSLALVRWALHNWVELFLVDKLVDLEAADVTRIDGHLHAWLHITGACHDSPHCDQLADIGRLHVTHLHDLLLAKFAGDEDCLVIALEFRWNFRHWVGISSRILTRDQALLQFDLVGHLHVEASLIHNHVKASQVFVAEVQARLGHVLVDHFTEHLDVCGGITNDSFDKAVVSVCAKEVLDIVDFDL